MSEMTKNEQTSLVICKLARSLTHLLALCTARVGHRHRQTQVELSQECERIEQEKEKGAQRKNPHRSPLSREFQCHPR